MSIVSRQRVSRQIGYRPSAFLRKLLLPCVLLFACLQIFASEHIHTDSQSDTSCVICAQADNTPISGTNNHTPGLSFNKLALLDTEIPRFVPLAPFAEQQARAPPRI